MANPVRKTLEYLGLVDESLEAEAPQRPVAVAEPKAQPAAQHAPVTPLRRSQGKATEALNEILTAHPKKYADVQTVADAFREGITVIINLSQMSEVDARRLIDFSSGLANGLLGKFERVTPKVFLLTPQSVAVTGGVEAEDTQATGFFN